MKRDAFLWLAGALALAACTPSGPTYEDAVPDDVVTVDHGAIVDVPATVDMGMDAADASDASDAAADTGPCRGADGDVCMDLPNSVTTCGDHQCHYACATGFLDCDGQMSNGCEINGATDPNHCGSCTATPCPAETNAPAVCVNGMCGFACTPGYLNCDTMTSTGCEVDGTTDPNHCGLCDTICAGHFEAPPTCVAGTCIVQCTGGYKDCNMLAADGCEINVTVSLTNCGTCNTVCSGAANADPVCQGGTCAITCRAGFADCDGSALNGCETPTTGDPNNCGACHTVCPVANPNCVAGACTN